MNEKQDVKQVVCGFGNLYKAMRISKKNVVWKDSVASYVKNGLVNCYKLKKQHETGTYKIDDYTVFKVHEPKERDIVSTRIKDRVFQRSFCDNYLYKTVTRSFIHDNGACQIGKGTDFSRERLAHHLKEHYKENGLVGGILKCDISDYFGSTSHEVAKDALRKRIKDDWAMQEAARIIDSFTQGKDPAKGMGLGSQVTQIIQLAVLDGIDHMIKEELGIKHYVRYMDDFILIHQDIEYLRYCRERIRAELDKKGLRLSPKKTQVQPVTQPVHFLGFSFRLNENGRVTMRILPEKVSHERRKLRRLVDLAKAGVKTRAEVDKCYEAFRAHAKKGDNRGVVRKMDKFYENLWEEHQNETSHNQGTTHGGTSNARSPRG